MNKESFLEFLNYTKQELNKLKRNESNIKMNGGSSNLKGIKYINKRYRLNSLPNDKESLITLVMALVNEWR